jgi:hypothetical protein
MKLSRALRQMTGLSFVSHYCFFFACYGRIAGLADRWRFRSYTSGTEHKSRNRRGRAFESAVESQNADRRGANTVSADRAHYLRAIIFIASLAFTGC